MISRAFEYFSYKPFLILHLDRKSHNNFIKASIIHHCNCHQLSQNIFS